MQLSVLGGVFACSKLLEVYVFVPPHTLRAPPPPPSPSDECTNGMPKALWLFLSERLEPLTMTAA